MYLLTRADSLHIPIAPKSVDLIICSPPYWDQRVYEDDGEGYEGQLGNEPTAELYLEHLWQVTDQLWRALKDTGSLWWNMGDKRSGSGSHNNATLGEVRGKGSTLQGGAQYSHQRQAPVAYKRDGGFGRPKSKMLLPHRYAIGCEDRQFGEEQLGWIVRQDQVWMKRNAIPDNTADRTSDKHEYWFHLTKHGAYYSAVDELREDYDDPDGTAARYAQGYNEGSHYDDQRRTTNNDLGGDWTMNPAGKRPASYTHIAEDPYEGLWSWLAATQPDLLDHYLAHSSPGVAPSGWLTSNEPLRAPGHLEQHFAAFPTEWPRRIIMGWSPPGICLECGEGRRPAVTEERTLDGEPVSGSWQTNPDGHQVGPQGVGHWRYNTNRSILGYQCPCYTGAPTVAELAAWNRPPTRPAVVLDPFVGTGTTLVCAEALGRIGVGLDLSGSYLDLARWRIRDSGQVAKVEGRRFAEAQGDLFG
jgi:DNA modification methylase